MVSDIMNTAFTHFSSCQEGRPSGPSSKWRRFKFDCAPCKSMPSAVGRKEKPLRGLGTDQLLELIVEQQSWDTDEGLRSFSLNSICFHLYSWVSRYSKPPNAFDLTAFHHHPSAFVVNTNLNGKCRTIASFRHKQWKKLITLWRFVLLSVRPKVIANHIIVTTYVQKLLWIIRLFYSPCFLEW